MSQDQTTPQDPVAQGPTPAFADQPQEVPGVEAQMDPKPDYGEASYRGSGRLEGKVALITGGDSGIGRAVALAFAREGADVAISYLESEEADAQETARAVTATGRQIELLPGDIQQHAHCRALVERTIHRYGRLDILVNNAAYQQTHGDIAEFEEAEIERTFRTNIYALFFLCQAALPHMQAGATIINTASIEAYKPEPMLLAYAATKAAIVNITKGLSQQVIARGIRVNAVAPGPVWTPLIPATMPAEQVQQFGQQAPIGRPAQPAELAPAYVFLASQESSYITGEVIGVTGGMLLP